MLKWRRGREAFNTCRDVLCLNKVYLRRGYSLRRGPNKVYLHRGYNYRDTTAASMTIFLVAV